VWELLELLPLRQRYVLAMWCFDLGIGEIAAELRTTPENVRFHKHAAIQSMRARLGVKIDESA
jgi:DNA-directed RNA polymerase specialized sigma24 family protein